MLTLFRATYLIVNLFLIVTIIIALIQVKRQNNNGVNTNYRKVLVGISILSTILISLLQAIVIFDTYITLSIGFLLIIGLIVLFLNIKKSNEYSGVIDSVILILPILMLFQISIFKSNKQVHIGAWSDLEQAIELNEVANNKMRMEIWRMRWHNKMRIEKYHLDNSIPFIEEDSGMIKEFINLYRVIDEVKEKIIELSGGYGIEGDTETSNFYLIGSSERSRISLLPHTDKYDINGCIEDIARYVEDTTLREELIGIEEKYLDYNILYRSTLLESVVLLNTLSSELHLFEMKYFSQTEEAIPQ